MKNVSKFLLLFFLVGSFSQIVPVDSEKSAVSLDREQEKIAVDEVIQSFMVDLVNKKIKNESDIQSAHGALRALIRCCGQLEENNGSLYVNDLLEAYPLLLEGYSELLQELTKAPREAIGKPIVGPGACDLTSISQLLNSLEAQLFACCTTINLEFQATFSILNADFVATITTIDAIAACFSTSLTVGTIITQPGSYCLANDVSGSFIIVADDVVLDLNGHAVSTGSISVLAGTNRTIRNGYITSALGVILTSNNNTAINNVSFTNSPAVSAISSTGSIGTSIRNVYVQNCLNAVSNTNDTTLSIDHLIVENSVGVGIVLTNDVREL